MSSKEQFFELVRLFSDKMLYAIEMISLLMFIKPASTTECLFGKIAITKQKNCLLLVSGQF